MTSDVVEALFMVFGLGAYGVWYSVKKLRVKRLLEDTPTSKSRSAAQGFNEFQGYAWPLVSTVRCSVGNDCVYYHISLQKHVKRGKNSKWETIFSRGLSADFLLVDGTGAVQVVIPDATFEVQARKTNWGSLSQESRANLLKNTFENFNSNGFPPSNGIFGFVFGGSFRIEERFVMLGSPLLVLGEFSSSQQTSEQPALAPSCPGLLGFFQKVQKDPRLKVGSASTFFDLNQDGKVSSAEIRRGLHYMARALIKAETTKANSAGATIVNTPAAPSPPFDCPALTWTR